MNRPVLLFLLWLSAVLLLGRRFFWIRSQLTVPRLLLALVQIWCGLYSLYHALMGDDTPVTTAVIVCSGFLRIGMQALRFGRLDPLYLADHLLFLENYYCAAEGLYSLPRTINVVSRAVHLGRGLEELVGRRSSGLPVGIVGVYDMDGYLWMLGAIVSVSRAVHVAQSEFWIRLMVVDVLYWILLVDVRTGRISRLFRAAEAWARLRMQWSVSETPKKRRVIAKMVVRPQ